jgi:hypothetical protein
LLPARDLDEKGGNASRTKSKKQSYPCKSLYLLPARDLDEKGGNASRSKSKKGSYPCKSLYLLPARDLTAGGCFNCSLLRYCCGRSASVSGRSTNAEGVTTRDVQWMLHWILVYLYSKLVQHPGASANYNSKRKKGIQKREGSEGLSLEKRTRLTKFSSHKLRESFTMQNHNIFLSKGQVLHALSNPA